jgi:predicted transcriptional regulator
MKPPYEDLRFLARSEDRFRVLETLVNGRHDRQSLHDVVTVSPATMGRLLDGLEQRQWIVHRGDEYETTELGNAVAEEFACLVHLLKTECNQNGDG